MAKKPTSPLKVTAKLTDGRVFSFDGIIMFDAILYHAWFAKYHPEVFETGEWMTHGSGYIGLPLRQTPENTGAGSVWAASMGIYAETAQSVEYWNKRPNFFGADKTDYLDQDKGVISDSEGRYRAYRTPCVVRTVKDGVIDFYCMGHKDEVLDLLSYIPALGKKPAIGYGRVESWTAEDIGEDYSVTHPEYGLMRPVPIIEGRTTPAKYPIREYGIKPPYWKPENRRLCYVPIR